jgi:hypothetical protein
VKNSLTRRAISFDSHDETWIPWVFDLKSHFDHSYKGASNMFDKIGGDLKKPRRYSPTQMNHSRLIGCCYARHIIAG